MLSTCVICGENAPDCRPCGDEFFSRPYNLVCHACHTTRRLFPTYTEPTTYTRLPSRLTVGCEIECGWPQRSVMPTAILPHVAQIKRDGSVSVPNAHPMEVCTTPSAGDTVLDTIEAVCAGLLAGGARTNASCGLHVHIGNGPPGISNWNRAQLTNLMHAWRRYEPIFLGFVNSTRRQNQYAKPLGPASDSQLWSDRYHALNLTAAARWGTVEVRLHHGTLKPKVIGSWVSILTRFVDTFSGAWDTNNTTRPADDRGMFNEFLHRQGLSMTLRKHYVARAWHYNKGPNAILKIRKESPTTCVPSEGSSANAPSTPLPLTDWQEPSSTTARPAANNPQVS